MTTSDAVINPAKMRIGGMDCGVCATKIENAVKRLPGVADINMSYATATLSLQLDEDRTTRERLEATIRTLGFAPVRFDAAPAQVTDGRAASEQGLSWWKLNKTRDVTSTGGFLAVALYISTLGPELSHWAYGAAALAGLVPVAFRAMIGAKFGTPFSIETLMTLATLGAVLIGADQEAAVIVFLFAVGEFVETIAAARSRAGIAALIDTVPRTARIEEAGQIREVSAEQLKIGDIVLVRPGDRVPSDGEVIDGQSELDQSPITGESAPIAKTVGDLVFAGSINGHGAIHVRLTHTADDNTISRIIHMVEAAQESKAPTARFIDRFAFHYTPAAMVAAAVVMLLPPLLLGGDWYTWLYRGLAILLIARPCALATESGHSPALMGLSERLSASPT